MALKFFDGFDEVPLTENEAEAYLNTSGFIGVSHMAGVSSNVRIGSGKALIRTDSIAASSWAAYVGQCRVAYAGVAFHTTSSDGLRRILTFSYDSLVGGRNTICHIARNGVGGISVLDGNLNLIKASDRSGLIMAATWGYVEAMVRPGTANNPDLSLRGQVTVKVDGETVIFEDNLTIGSGFLYTNVVGVFQGSTENSTSTLNGPNVSGFHYDAWDDFYVCDDQGADLNTFLGDVVVTTQFPNAAGSSTTFSGFTSGSGFLNHYQAVNEISPDDDLNFIFSDVAGEKDMFNTQDLPVYVLTPLAVSAQARVKKSAVGAGAYKIKAKLGATEVGSPTLGTTIGYTSDRYMLTTKPGGGAWTISDVNALEVGVEIAS